MSSGIRNIFPGAEIVEAPMADGGEGTLETLLASLGGRRIVRTVTGPLGNPVEATFGILKDNGTAVIEMAAASGLTLVPEAMRDPRITTSRGTGELIRAALDEGCTRIIIGIGGSATNDGGAGMAQALGYLLLDRSGHPLPPGGLPLQKLVRIQTDLIDPRISHVEVLVACDVTNPLTGPDGASRVYGPQKGADPEAVDQLDHALENLAERIHKDLGKDLRDLPGGGAAGGMGAGLVAFLNARLQNGVEIIAGLTGLEEKLNGADLVITGEGRIDSQTIHGKTPIGVAKLAKSKGLPVLAVAGGLGPGSGKVYSHGIDGMVSITQRPMTLQEAVENAGELVASATEQLLRIYLSGRPC